MLGSSRVAAQLAASQEGLSSMSESEFACGLKATEFIFIIYNNNNNNKFIYQSAHEQQWPITNNNNNDNNNNQQLSRNFVL
jgi:hypothetical protein